MAQGFETTLKDAALINKVGRRTVADANYALRQAEEIGEGARRWERLSADELNVRHVARGYEPPYKPRTRVIYREAKGEEKYFRVHLDDNQSQRKEWLMKEDPRKFSRKGLKERYSLSDKYLEGGVFVSEVIVKEGTPMRVSIAGRNNFGPGGGIQWEILGGKEWLEKATFSEVGKL